MSTNFNLKANGKLLISGEYLVLNGAKALAFPICFGQEMIVTPISEPILNWNSIEKGINWFTASFNLQKLSVINTSDSTIALKLQNILQTAHSLNSEFLAVNQYGYSIEVNADYPLKWGFGSSSTLIYLIANWAKINEFQLFKKLYKGSAYDLACASQQQPILYQITDELPIVTPTKIGNAIKNHCLFAYLGNKQNSNIEIERYKQSVIPTQKDIDRISELAVEFCEISNENELIELIKEHEQILSSILKKPVVAKQRFPDFKGAVKSLGAWGGDFAMFASNKPLNELRTDLKQLGITTMFSYDELLIKQ